MSANEGIQVYGGSINVGGSLATGRNASAVSVIGEAPARIAERGQEELAARLSELAGALDRHQARLDDAEAAIRSLRETAEELQRPQPDKPRLTALLAGLRTAVGTAAELAGGVAGLEHAIAAIF
jgi:chromosome segregation ATPase